jgi:hypothetical protein
MDRAGITERADIGKQTGLDRPREQAGAVPKVPARDARMTTGRFARGRIRRWFSRPAIVVQAFLAVLLFVTGACGEDPPHEAAPSAAETSRVITSGDADSTSSPDTLQADDSPQQEGAPGRGPGEWTPNAVRGAHETSEIAVVEALRAARHDDYDRFVVAFRSGVVPGYAVRYLDEQPYACGSGRTMDVPGEAVLELRFEPAGGHTETGAATVDHSERTFGFGALREAEVSCDFEGVFTVVLGTTTRLPFRVLELSEPARVVVDLRRSDQ